MSVEADVFRDDILEGLARHGMTVCAACRLILQYVAWSGDPLYSFRMSRRSISLVWELEELEQAVDAARVLCDASSQNQYATEHDARIAPRVTSAVLTLVGQRLGLIRRVIHGCAPIEALAGGHNLVKGKQRHVDDGDVLLTMDPRQRKKKP